MMFRRRKPRAGSVLTHEPIYFPCPSCGRPVDALNQAMIANHATWHADESLRLIRESLAERDGAQ